MNNRGTASMSDGSDTLKDFAIGRREEAHGMAAGDQHSKYALSFTSGALLGREAALVAPIYLRERDWVKTRAAAQDSNVLQRRVASSATRILRALIDRLQQLTEAELQIIAQGTSSERGHLMWAAACRRYDLIAEFAEEVLRERFLTLAEAIAYDDFDGFFRGKALWHEELGGLTESTYKKLRQVVFRMMFEAGLTTGSGRIEPALMSPRVIDCLQSRVPSDLRFFPIAQTPVTEIPVTQTPGVDAPVTRSQARKR
jgi:hypothetical protein